MLKKAVLLSLAVSLLAAAPALASPQAPVAITNWTTPVDGPWGLWASTATNPNNGNTIAVYFWPDDRTSPTKNSYFTQVLDESGAPVGAPKVLTDTLDRFGYSQPSVAYNPVTGGWLSCWGERGVPSSDPNPVRCAELDEDGDVVGTPSTMFTLANGNDWFWTSLAWSKSKGEFLMVTSGYGEAYARFVKPSGEPSGSTIDFEPTADFEEVGGSGLAYSPTSDRFMVYLRGKAIPAASGEIEGLWVWLLDGDGNRIGSPQRINSADLTLGYGNGSIVWNRKTDEFVVISWNYQNNYVYPLPLGGDVVTRRFSASDGVPAGDLTSKVVDSGTFTANRNRPAMAANPFGGPMLGFMSLKPKATSTNGIYALDVDEAGAMTDPALVTGGTSDFVPNQRTWLSFNPHSCEYLALIGGTPASAAQQLYSVRYTQSEPCKADLTVAKAGAGSGSIAGTATEDLLGAATESVGEGTTSLYRSTSVTLTATAASGSTFTGWSGACSGSGECTVSMDEARSVTATFAAVPVPVPSEITVRTPLVVGSSIRTRVKVPAAGRISQSGTFGSGGSSSVAKTRTACRASSKSVSAAGTYRLTCSLTSAARSARKKGAVRVRLTTRFTPSGGGDAQTVVRTVVLRSLKPNYTG